MAMTVKRGLRGLQKARPCFGPESLLPENPQGWASGRQDQLGCRWPAGSEGHVGHPLPYASPPSCEERHLGAAAQAHPGSDPQPSLSCGPGDGALPHLAQEGLFYRPWSSVATRGVGWTPVPPPTPSFLRTPACEPRIHTLPDVPQQPPPPPPVPAKKTRAPQPAGSGEIVYQSHRLSGLAPQSPQGMCLWWEPEVKLGHSSGPDQRPYTRAFPTRGFDTLSEATDLGFLQESYS